MRRGHSLNGSSTALLWSRTGISHNRTRIRSAVCIGLKRVPFIIRTNLTNMDGTNMTLNDVFKLEIAKITHNIENNEPLPD